MAENDGRAKTSPMEGGAATAHQAGPGAERTSGSVGMAAAPTAAEDSAGIAAVQTQISALRADMQRLQERMAALHTQVATAMAEAPEINARINAALVRLAAAQKKKGPV